MRSRAGHLLVIESRRAENERSSTGVSVWVGWLRRGHLATVESSTAECQCASTVVFSVGWLVRSRALGGS